VPARVFCASHADVFDNQVPAEWRADLFDLIRATPWLDWMLLTKRPQNIRKMLPPDWGAGWRNVWLGVTAENQVEANRRLKLLRAIPAALRFVSAEPLLERVRLDLDGIHWVIGGGESGRERRHFDLDLGAIAARSMRHPRSGVLLQTGRRAACGRWRQGAGWAGVLRVSGAGAGAGAAMMRRLTLAVALVGLVVVLVGAQAPAVCAYGTAWPPGCVPFGWLGQPTRPAITPWPVAPWPASAAPVAPRYQCRATSWSACQ
jgi:hypothetical protein